MNEKTTDLAMTRKEAADRLRCSTSKIDRMILAGELRATAIGRSKLVNAQDVESMLKPLTK